MKALTAGAVVVVLGVAAWAGVAFSGCPTSPSGLVWLNPTATAFPSTHTYIGCTITGGNTATLTFKASTLAPGDGCTFAAKLSNTGSSSLVISPSLTETTPAGSPTFATCFSFVTSGGPAGGRLAGGSSSPYTFVLELLSSAGNSCEKVVGTVTETFTGTPPCPSLSSPPRGLFLGPKANLKNANLADLDLAGFDMAWDNLVGANLACDDLQGTNLQSANLQGATLTNAVLTGANLPCADLIGALVTYATLTSANFQGATLQAANLQGSLLTGVPHLPTNFDQANLTGVNLANVTATGYITTTGATITGALNVASCVATSGTAVYCDEL